ncbi:MAG TPA: hypothetical protein PK413_02530, partial [Thermoanaerobaculia bacterium]|nr:hypothetical protein [Thermoanaerobaculia bacterium]
MREGVLRALPGPPAECAKALAARLAVVAGLAFSLLIQASYQLEAASAAETRFLAWLAALVLLGCELAASVVIAPLVLLVAWVVPLEGPLRAACVGGLLVLAWALSACRRLGRGAPQEPLSRVFWLLLPLALATQALLRGDRLLALAEPLRALGALVVLPVVVALALALLARREGLALAALAGLLSALPAPGWNVAAAMALLGLAAGTVVFDATSPRFLRTLAAAALLASLAWEPRAGLVALLAALALGPGWLGGAAAAAGALLSLVAPARPWDQAFEGWLLLPALVPLLPTA